MKCLAPWPLFCSTRAVLLLTAMVVLQLGAEAQSQYCLGGDLQHLTTAQRAACNSKLAEVRSAAHHFGAPQGWHFVMVCGEDNWKAYTPFSAHTAKELETASADTDLVAHTTYLREARLEAGGSPLALQATLAKMLAGIVLGTADEAAIQAQVNSWLSAETEGRASPVLQASR